MQPTPSDLIRTIAEVMECPEYEAWLTPPISRKTRVTLFRQACAWWLRQHMGLAWAEIAALIGYPGHDGVLYADRRWREGLESQDPRYCRIHEAVSQRVLTPLPLPPSEIEARLATIAHNVLILNAKLDQIYLMMADPEGSA